MKPSWQRCTATGANHGECPSVQCAKRPHANEPHIFKCCAHTSDCRPRCNIAHARIALEEKCIRVMLRTLKTNGWLPTTVYNSAGDRDTVKTERSVIDALSATDESSLIVQNASHPWSHRIDIVRGNGIDLICDYSVNQNDDDNFDWVMTQITDHFETYENIT